MPRATLTSLPNELLCEICGYLPDQTVFDLIRVCRYTRQACDQWTVWKGIVCRSRSFPYGVPVFNTDNSNDWKRYAIADTIASVRDFYKDWELSDLEEWLPQLAATRHILTEHRNDSFQRLFDYTWDLASGTGDLADATIPEADNTFNASTTPMSDLEAWTLVQAAAFCVAVNEFSYSYKIQTIDWNRRHPSWPTTTAHGISGRDGEGRSNLIARQQHAIGNVIAGSIRARLKFVYTLSPAMTPPGVYQPPSVATMPFQQLMKILPPFTKGGLDMFSMCHIPMTTKPDFIVSDAWTGSYHTLGSDSFTFDPIGGRSYSGLIQDSTALPPGRSFEDVVHFHRVGEDDGTTYQLESNDFHSKEAIFRLKMNVNRKTGQLTIAHWRPDMGWYVTAEGVMTPFGIVACMHIVEDCWLYMWKVDWSPFRFPVRRV